LVNDRVIQFLSASLRKPTVSSFFSQRLPKADPVKLRVLIVGETSVLFISGHFALRFAGQNCRAIFSESLSCRRRNDLYDKFIKPATTRDHSLNAERCRAQRLDRSRGSKAISGEGAADRSRGMGPFPKIARRGPIFARARARASVLVGANRPAARVIALSSRRSFGVSPDRSARNASDLCARARNRRDSSSGRISKKIERCERFMRLTSRILFCVAGKQISRPLRRIVQGFDAM